MQTQVMHTGRALTPGQRWASRVTCAVLVSLWTHDVPTHTTDGLGGASPLWKAAGYLYFLLPCSAVTRQTRRQMGVSESSPGADRRFLPRISSSASYA